MATAKKAKTVTLQDAYGNDVEVPVGSDGKNPVSPNNPPAKAAFFSTNEERPELQDGVKEHIDANQYPVGDEADMTVEAAKKADDNTEAKSDS